MRQACKEGKAGDWADFQKMTRLSVWEGVNVRECYSEVEQREKHRKSIAQLIHQKSTDFLRRTIVLVEEKGGVARSCVCRHCHRFPMEDYIWWVSPGHGDLSKKRRSSAIGGVRRVASTLGAIEPASWSYQTVRTAEKQTFFAHTLRRKEYVTT